MHFKLLLAPLLAASSAVAQHVHFEPPLVHKYVESMMSEFHEWKTYPGPSPTWWHQHPHPPYPTHPIPPPPTDKCDYWLADVKHQGIAAFNPSPDTYTVFRNVKDYGAKGDGVTDDTDAINSAISSGGRCAPGSCASTTVTPAVVYFPPGTVRKPIGRMVTRNRWAPRESASNI
jgi:glucan 1,3-beta-glucosidase